ncbi:MAG: amino acid-binding protein [Actinomycetales bacterium]|nr:MAG: amino acid-binding protein [Actinomycetales bacterium]
MPVLAVTVIGDDRPGIVADLTSALADLGANLEDSTMTLLRGHFAMVVLARSGATLAEVEAALAPLGASGALSVDVRALPDPGPVGALGRPWSLQVHGADRPGIVAAITRVIAAHGGNIVNLGTRFGTDLYVLSAEVELPATADVTAVVDDLSRTAASLGVKVSFDHLDDDVL